MFDVCMYVRLFYLSLEETASHYYLIALLVSRALRMRFKPWRRVVTEQNHRISSPGFLRRSEKDAYKPVAKYFNLPNYSKQQIAVCGLPLYPGSISRKLLHMNLSFRSLFFIPNVSTNTVAPSLCM